MDFKSFIKQLSRRNWFFYQTINKVKSLYGSIHCCFGGGIKINKGNCVRLDKNIVGSNNYFEAGDDCVIDHLSLHIIGSNNIIEIGDKCTIQKGCALWIIGNNCKVTIGDDTRIGANCAIEVQEDNQCIEIGNDNLWSHNIRLRNNDSHYIYDTITGERTNYPKPIIIGNHVWIAAYATVLKGVTINDGAVIGTHALVTKDIPNNVVAAGIPAKVLQSNIEWSDNPK